MRFPECLLAAVIALAAALPVAAQDARFFNGTWQAEYADAVIGRVTGEAVIDVEAGTAEVTYAHPESGAEHRLVSRSFERDGNRLRIELAGQSPAAPLDDGRGYPVTGVVVPEQAPEVSASLGGSEISISVAPRVASDEAVVTLDLTLTEGRSLVGTWHYRADPFTRRARDGLGRIGVYAGSDDGGEQSGSEIWARPVPNVITAFTLNPQLGWNTDLNVPRVPYPFQEDAFKAESTTRYIVIAGNDFPKIRTDPVDLISLNPAISYGRMIDPDSTFQFVGGQLDPFGSARARVAETFAEELGPENAKRYAETLDYIVVEATIRKSGQGAEGEIETLPGLQRFRLNGSSGGWTLAFGNNGAQIRILRPVDPASALRRRVDRFNVFLRNPDQSISHAWVGIEVIDLVDTGDAVASVPLWVRSGDRITGSIDDVDLRVLPPDTREKIARLPGMSWLHQSGEGTITGTERVLRPGRYRGKFGTFEIGADGSYSYEADPVPWLSIGHEPTEHLFLPEVFRIAVRTDVVLPRDRIDAMLGRAGETFQVGDGHVVPLRRDAGDPTFYLSDPIYMSGSGQEEPPPAATAIRVPNCRRRHDPCDHRRSWPDLCPAAARAGARQRDAGPDGRWAELPLEGPPQDGACLLR